MQEEFRKLFLILVERLITLRIMKGPFFKFVWFFFAFGDLYGKCHLVAWEEIRKRPFEKFEYELVISRFRSK
jgi:hypothetical protein